MEGTITWIPVNTALPPPIRKGRYSVPVLLALPNGGYAISEAVYLLHGAFVDWSYTDTYYNPTHWAYINAPTT